MAISSITDKKHVKKIKKKLTAQKVNLRQRLKLDK